MLLLSSFNGKIYLNRAWLFLAGRNITGILEGTKTRSFYFNSLERAIIIDRDSTTSELHLHVHTHNHDGKSFVAEHSQLLNEKYEEIVRKKRQTESEIDQLESYYEVAGGVKKKRLFISDMKLKVTLGKIFLHVMPPHH